MLAAAGARQRKRTLRLVSSESCQYSVHESLPSEQAMSTTQYKNNQKLLRPSNMRVKAQSPIILLCMCGTRGIGEGRGQSRGTAGLVSRAPCFQIWRHRHRHRFYASLFHAAHAQRHMRIAHSGQIQLTAAGWQKPQSWTETLGHMPKFRASEVDPHALAPRTSTTTCALGRAQWYLDDDGSGHGSLKGNVGVVESVRVILELKHCLGARMRHTTRGLASATHTVW